jgi:hypothetical protein
MKRVCPNPISWAEAFESLAAYARSHACTPPAPPRPLILAGWVGSNDQDKMLRWEDTVTWAYTNGCGQIIEGIAEQDFYFVDNPTTYVVGPMGGPMHRPWAFDPKPRPSSTAINRYLEELSSKWLEIVGKELGLITRPLAFSGRKLRRLLVWAHPDMRPPWGDWARRSSIESERRTFTQFRAAINNAIIPHEIDHVEFLSEPTLAHR